MNANTTSPDVVTTPAPQSPPSTPSKIPASTLLSQTARSVNVTPRSLHTISKPFSFHTQARSQVRNRNPELSAPSSPPPLQTKSHYSTPQIPRRSRAGTNAGEFDSDGFTADHSSLSAILNERPTQTASNAVVKRLTLNVDPDSRRGADRGSIYCGAQRVLLKSTSSTTATPTRVYHRRPHRNDENQAPRMIVPSSFRRNTIATSSLPTGSRPPLLSATPRFVVDSKATVTCEQLAQSFESFKEAFHSGQIQQL